MKKNIESRNGIIGLAIGDAMGVPLKWVDRNKLFANPTTQMVEGGTYGKAKGTWSDSTSLSLATIDSIVKSYGVSTEDMGNRFIDWMENAQYTACGERFDIGRTTMMALSKFQKNKQPFESGSSKEESNGNDCLMRMLPIAYYCYSSKFQARDIYDIVKKVCYVTHAHDVSILGCYIYVLYAVKLLEGKPKFDAYREVQKTSFSQFSRSSLELYSRILKNDIYEVKIDDIKSTSYIVDTLEATFWVLLNTDGFNQAVIGAINLGNETDTIGACTGGLAGIIYGIKSINPDWKIDLKKYLYLRKMCDEFDKVLNPPIDKYELPRFVLGNEEKIIKIIQGDITKLNVDVYVNSANNSLLGGEGIDELIHDAAGSKLIDKCKELNGCETGEAKVTRGYDAKADFIIHAVAPKWYDETAKKKEKLLRECYENSLDLFKDFGGRNIAFPCLGIGIYGCPIEIAAKVAIQFAVSVAREENPMVDNIYLVCAGNTEYEYYMKYFKDIVKGNTN